MSWRLCNNLSVFFPNLLFMLFGKVKIERAIKGNSDSVTEQWPTVLWPLTLWTLTLVLLLWFVPLWSSLSTWIHQSPQLQPINILKTALCNISLWRWPQMEERLMNPEMKESDISEVPLPESEFLTHGESWKEGGKKKISLYHLQPPLIIFCWCCLVFNRQTWWIWVFQFSHLNIWFPSPQIFLPGAVLS